MWVELVVLWTESDWNSKVRPDFWSCPARDTALEFILHYKLERASHGSDCTLIKAFFLFLIIIIVILPFFIRRSGNTHTYEGHALMSRWFLAAEYSYKQPSRSGINISARVTLHSNMQYCFCLLHKDVKTFVSVEVKQLCGKKKKCMCLTVLHMDWDSAHVRITIPSQKHTRLIVHICFENLTINLF